MTVLETLKELASGNAIDTAFIEEARAHSPYEVEDLMNTIVIWSMSAKSSDILLDMLKESVQMANVKALQTFAANGLHSEEVPYLLHPFQVSKDATNHRESVRVGLVYKGPKLKNKLPIPTSKEELRTTLRRMVVAAVNTIQLQDRENGSLIPTKDKPVDVSLQTRFVKLIARYTSHEMVFKVIPNKRNYGELVLGLMPKMVDRVIIQPQSSNGVESSWKIRAAGKPWLAKIGRALDGELAKVMGKR